MSRIQSAFHEIGSKLTEKLSARGDAKYFTTDKGSFDDLKLNLSSLNDEKKIGALKQIIAMMASGRDVTVLFPDVVSCMQTGSVHIKKLVYLYIIHTASYRPNTAILAVNTFVNHCNDVNPMLRALALRTLSSIHLIKILCHVIAPLKNALNDNDAYVRRNACIAVAKVFQTSPERSMDEGLHERLIDKIRDENAAVVSAAVASLMDIQACHGIKFEIRREHVPRILEALSSASEWAQTTLLEGLMSYNPRSPKEALAILEKTTPRLQHANAGLVITAVRAILRFLPYANMTRNEEDVYFARITQPLVSLVSLEHEVQFITLRCICLLQCAYPNRFNFNISTFYCPFNAPPYVKKAKLEASISLVNLSNVHDVIQELNEYAQDVEINLARYSIMSLGRIAAHFAWKGKDSDTNEADAVTTQCVEILLRHISVERIDIAEEALKALRDVSRYYIHENTLNVVLQSLNQYRETNAMAHCAWIIGLHANHIQEPDTVFNTLCQLPFKEYGPSEQQAILVCSLRLYIKHPDKMKNIVKSILGQAVEGTPDIRERAIIYTRVMSSKPELLNKMLTVDRSGRIELRIELSRDEALEKANSIGNISSLYQIPSLQTLHRKISYSLSDGEENLVMQRKPSRESAANDQPKSFFVLDRAPVSKSHYVDLWNEYAAYGKFIFGKHNDFPLSYNIVTDVATACSLRMIRDKRESTYDALFLTGTKPDGTVILIEIDIQKGKGTGVKLVVRGPSSSLSEESLNYLTNIFTSKIPNLVWS